MEIEQHAAKHQWIKKGNQKYLATAKKWKHNILNLTGCSKGSSKREVYSD